MTLRNLLLTNTNEVAEWITKVFPVLQTILIILISVFALIIIGAVLTQPSKPAGGSNVVMGTNNESYYAHNKSHNKEGRLNKAIVISATLILVLTLLYFISLVIYNG